MFTGGPIPGSPVPHWTGEAILNPSLHAFFNNNPPHPDAGLCGPAGLLRRQLRQIGLLRSPAPANTGTELFLQMMTLSRRYQYQTIAGRVGGPDLGFHKVEKLETAGKRVVFQGLEGAYGHAAALQFFGKDADIHHVRRFEDMMVEIQEGKADFAVLPIENSSAGAVTDNYDLLLKYDNVIVAETFLPVHHYLLGTPDAELSDVKRVFAHPQALMQSSDFLNQHDWQQLSMENNAVAAQKVRD